MRTVETKMWEELARMDPGEVCKRSLVTYDDSKARYILPYLNEELFFSLRDRRILKFIDNKETEPTLEPRFRITLLSYLINAKDTVKSETLVKPDQLPGGDVYFRVHSVGTEELARKYGNAPGDFLQAGISIGGRSIGQGDAAFELTVFPHVFFTYILWAGDSELPAEVVILVDPSIAQYIQLDMLRYLISTVSRKILGSK